MRRLILIFFVFLVLGVGLTLVFREDSGYVRIAFAGWQLETSLLFAAAVVLVGIWALITLWRLLVAGALMPRTVGQWRHRRRLRKTRQALDAGLLRLAESDWRRAEYDLMRLVDREGASGVNYLYAALAAQRQGRIEQRDRYLEKATADDRVTEVAVLLIQARLQIEQQKHGEAVASLSRLYGIEPSHPAVLTLYARQCERTGDYARVRQLVPGLYKSGQLTPDQVDAMARNAWLQALQQPGVDAGSLNALWKSVPRRLREDLPLRVAHARALHAARADKQAARVVRDWLKQRWSAELVLLYAELSVGDDTTQLKDTERWLKQYGKEPELHIAAGCMCARNRLWGRAQRYADDARKKQTRHAAWLALGQLFETLNQMDEARACYRQGLIMRNGD